jgi:hypothetical protein
MEILVGEKYLITSDEYNLVLKEKKVSKEQNEYVVTIGYYGKLEQLVSALFLKELRDSEVKSINNLVDTLHQVSNSLKIDISEKVKANFKERNIESDDNKWF